MNLFTGGIMEILRFVNFLYIERREEVVFIRIIK